MWLFRVNLKNASHFIGVAYPPDKIHESALELQAFHVLFYNFARL